jgi:hypothetical protein
MPHGSIVPTPPHGASAPTPPGIYELGGTMHGEPCLIAYYNEGEVRIEAGVGAYHALESWLVSRGVKLPDSRPALFLI